MSTKKTIQINPELFKMSGNRTKKNRERKELTLNPIVSPNNLKNKLLKRIKDHKTQEFKKTNTNAVSSGVKDSITNNSTYTDEFYGAIDYLSDLSKKQKQQKAINNKTLKNQSTPTIISPMNSTINPMMNQQISLELPPELAEPIISTQTSEIFNVNYKSIDDVPYGCLKNGKKKTYREWKELTNPTMNFELPNMIRPPTPPKKNLGINLGDTGNLIAPMAQSTIPSREDRLEQIKNKLRKIQEQESSSKMQTLKELDMIDKKINNVVEIDDLPNFDEKQSSLPDVEELMKVREEKKEKENPKNYLKKTVKRKFTLGKSDKLRRVAVLIKDRQTRKNIINAQKHLKKTNITDVRKYLRQHGMIKVGTTCPADILRKTFESAMLAGEVTNINKDTLLHNFLNEEKN
jgi:hypothetical protein